MKTDELESSPAPALLGVGFEGEAYEMKTLLTRAIKYAQYIDRGSPRWSGVGQIFSVGSTTAIAMCKAVGLDPHESVPPIDTDEDA